MRRSPRGMDRPGGARRGGSRGRKGARDGTRVAPRRLRRRSAHGAVVDVAALFGRRRRALRGGAAALLAAPAGGLARRRPATVVSGPTCASTSSSGSSGCFGDEASATRFGCRGRALGSLSGGAVGSAAHAGNCGAGLPLVTASMSADLVPAEPHPLARAKAIAQASLELAELEDEGPPRSGWRTAPTGSVAPSARGPCALGVARWCGSPPSARSAGRTRSRRPTCSCPSAPCCADATMSR